MLGQIVIIRGQHCDLALPADAEATLCLVAFRGPTLTQASQLRTKISEFDRNDRERRADAG
jgi:hypothetical protein